MRDSESHMSCGRELQSLGAALEKALKTVQVGLGSGEKTS